MAGMVERTAMALWRLLSPDPFASCPGTYQLYTDELRMQLVQIVIMNKQVRKFHTAIPQNTNSSKYWNTNSSKYWNTALGLLFVSGISITLGAYHIARTRTALPRPYIHNKSVARLSATEGVSRKSFLSTAVVLFATNKPSERRTKAQERQEEQGKEVKDTTKRMLPQTPSQVPKLVVFDLDGTLWYPEMFQLWGGGSPFSQDPKTGNVADRAGTKVQLLGVSREILASLHCDDAWKNTKVAVASRTDEPAWAQECMEKIRIKDGLYMKQTISYEEIYYGQKDKHLRALHDKTGIAYDDMMFFDNESANVNDVAALGVHSFLVPHGMDAKSWQAALEKYARSKMT